MVDEEEVNAAAADDVGVVMVEVGGVKEALGVAPQHLGTTPII